MEEWKNFKKDKWNETINVSNFIKTNYQNYDGDSNFLEGTTEKTDKVWSKCTDLLKEELKKGEKIQLVGFGTFEVSERAAREGRNPQTGETMQIAASKSPKFKAGKALKDAIN